MSSNETRGDQPDTARVKDLLSQIPRTLLAYKLYAPTNQLRQEMFRELVRKFDNVFEGLESIPLKVEANTLLYEGERLLELPEEESHFVFQLFKDGARQISFSRGLTAEEISTFLDIIRTRPGRQGELYNIVDAMWEANLPHIEHVAVDGFTELMAHDTGRDTEQAGAEAVAFQFKQVIGALAGNEQPPSAPVEEPATTTGQPIIRVNERVASPLRNIMSEPLSTTQDLARWSRYLAEETGDDLLTQIEDLLFYVLEDPSDPLSEDDFARLFGQLLRERLLLGRFGASSELVMRLQRIRFELPQWIELPNKVLGEFGVPALTELVTMSEETPAGPTAAVAALTFFESYLAFSDDALVELLQLDLNEFGANLLGAMLYRRLSAQPTEWIARLSSIPAKPLIIALNDPAIEQRKGTDFLALLWSIFRLDDANVAVAAMRSYPGPFDTRFRNFLIEQLDSDNLDIRCAAAERLSDSVDSGVGAFLVNRVRRQGLETMDTREVKVLMGAILKLGAERYVPFIRSQLEQVGVLRGTLGVLDSLTAQKSDERVEVVLTALADCHAPPAVELIREVRQKAKGRLREHCDAIWRTLVKEWKGGEQSEPADSEPADSETGMSQLPEEVDELPPEEALRLPPEQEDEISLATTVELPLEREGELPPESEDELPPEQLDEVLKSFLDEVD